MIARRLYRRDNVIMSQLSRRAPEERLAFGNRLSREEPRRAEPQIFSKLRVSQSVLIYDDDSPI